MVISHQYQYVYVQTMKTASSAIAAELCNNYEGEMILNKHSTISEFREQASQDEKRYFTFSGVRNPLDVAVSRFELRKSGRNQGPSHEEQREYIESVNGDFNAYFYEFLINRYEKKYDVAIVPRDWASRDFQSIDYIYRYESLQQEFSSILKKIGIEQKRELPLLNKTKTKRDYMNYYDDWTLRLACRLFRDYMADWGHNEPVTGKNLPNLEERVKIAVELRQQSDRMKNTFLGRTLCRNQQVITEQAISILEDQIFDKN